MTMIAYLIAALAEIGGCYAMWAWTRGGASGWWLLPGALSLGLFAWALTWVDAAAAGRAFAAYGGVYIAASLAWMWFVEGERPDLRDGLGAALCLLGAGIILYGRGR